MPFGRDLSVTWVRLNLDLPDRSWAADVSQEVPEASIRLLGGLSGDRGGHSIISIVAPDPDQTLEAIRRHEDVQEFSVLQRSDDEVTAQLETTEPTLLLAAKRSGLPIEPPIRISDGRATITVVGVEDRVAELGRRLGDRTLEYDIEYIDRPAGFDGVLTDTQLEIVFAALEHGYYERPRRCTLTELAATIGVAKSTASATLRDAEAALVERFAESLPRETYPEVVV